MYSSHNDNRVADVEFCDPKPVAPKVNPDNIPELLKQHHQWSLWRYEKIKDRWTKIPIKAFSLHRARSNDPYSWVSFEEALSRYQALLDTGEVDGLAYFIGKNDVVGIDVDHCCTDGELSSQAAEIINTLDSYSEFSPSGEGLRVFCRGSIPMNGKKPDYRNGPYEMYDNTTNRFLTVTGRHIDGTPKEVEERGPAIETVHTKYVKREKKKVEKKAKPTPTQKSYSLPDDVDVANIVELASQAKNGLKFRKLWSGDWGDYPSQSEADLALAMMLAFYIGPNEEKVDVVFRESGLYRDKWERIDYRDNTLSKAIDLDEFYNWSDTKQAEMEEKLEQVFSSAPESVENSGKSSEISEELLKLTKGRKAMTIKELDSLPDLQWQIDRFIPKESFACIFGPSGSGKSFIALDMAMCIATGKKFMGMYDVAQGPVLYILSEGSRGFRKRIHAWLNYHELEQPKNIRFIPASFDFLEQEEAIAALVIAQRDMGEMPAFIVVDTLSRNMSGSDAENDDMKSYVGNLDYIKEKSGATVCSVHHTGWNQTRYRGGSTLKDSCDVMLKLDGKEVEGLPHTQTDISCFKMKDFDDFEPMTLLRKLQNTTRGASCVWTPQASWLTKRLSLKPELRTFLELLEENYRDEFFHRKDAVTVAVQKGTAERTAYRYFDQLTTMKFIIKLDDGQSRLNEKLNPGLSLGLLPDGY